MSLTNRKLTSAGTDDADSADVERFLRANPNWLADRPDLYRTLCPPIRVYGDTLADHMAAMVHMEREHAAEMAARADGLLTAGRAAATCNQLVQQAVLAIIRANDPAECVTGEFAAFLRVDAAALCIEDHLPNTRWLPPGFIKTLLDNRDIVIRDDPPESLMIHAEAARLARRDALVRVPWHGPATLLALASRDDHWPDWPQASALTFLCRALGAALERNGPTSPLPQAGEACPGPRSGVGAR
jgi:uncharacterized protein